MDWIDFICIALLLVLFPWIGNLVVLLEFRIVSNSIFAVGAKAEMAGGFVDEKDPNYNFRGWRFYLNSYTLRGRFNVS